MITKKLLQIQKSIVALSRNKDGYGYKYVSGDKLLSFIRPQMDELGLLLMPNVDDVKTSVVTYDAWDKSAKKIVTKTEILYNIMMTMMWVDAEDGETLSQKWAGAGQNLFDKGFGSALTYGERYYLLKLFHLQTDRDDVDYISIERDEAIDMANWGVCGLSGEVYMNLVETAAKGGLTKTGETPREWLIAHKSPTDDDIAHFDIDVKTRKNELKI